MPDKGYTVITGDAISRYADRVLEAQMRLELRGLRNSQRSAFAIAAERLEMPVPRNRRQRERVLERWVESRPK